ncbi:hypothetical protein WJX72_010853 [[Myrmecia] bisecta]|uniref:Protein kinase domain-containing protein n=1 Tax=[Myrmecia] bisecta TaxID=41462 RepID=A0AAW1Q5M0_9CHLO
MRQLLGPAARDASIAWLCCNRSPNAMSQELSNIITNGKLQAALSSQGISTSTVALVSTSQVVPTSRTDCAAGVVAGECIGGTKNSSALQLWLIIVIAVGCTAALGAFVVIVVFCCCRHRRAKQARQESMRRNYIEPTHAKPFNYPEFAKTNSPQGPATPVVADAASPAHAHPVLQMQPVRSPLAMGAGVAMGTDAIMRIPEASLKDGAMYISPKDSLAGVERIAAANAQLRGFQAKLTTANAQLAVRRLLQKHQLEEQRLADPGATGWNVMKLHAALQYLTNTFTFAGKYIMQGGKFKGSNCVVARGREMEAFGSRPVTIKFFVDAQEFVHEKRFHQQARSKNHIPAVLDTFEAGEVSMTSDGVKNPACIVLERGEYTLSHFLTRMDRNPGSLGSKDILVALAEAVNYLHSRNIVHRGISADSLMWFDSTSRWRLAEFGSWGRRGADAPLSYTLRTAAPEVVAADAMGMLAWTRMVPHRAADTLGPTYFVVDPASDVWAIGVVAWELFTGRQLFADNFSDEDVMAMLLGLKALPFEADPSLWVLFRDSQAANLVKGLLQRQPEDRLLIRELLSAAANLTDN